mmetsp:Transcript_5465/g.8081  ORF Transcript_5465/g.8081 Transcript_5465/m.8081 type:complete len:328 (+) Transcript_5465:96-1079(+)
MLAVDLKDGKIGAKTFEYSKGQEAVRLFVVDEKGTKSVAEVALFGAHVMRFTQIGSDGKSQDLMWTSKHAVLDGSKAIRGGVPVIFPQFNVLGPMKSHGFARTAVWTLKTITSDIPGRSISAVLTLKESEESVKMWGSDKKFTYDYTVSLTAGKGGKSSTLALNSKVTNTGTQSFGYTFALHTYFPVSDITQAAVSAPSPLSVKGLKYIDSLMEGKGRADKVKTETNDEIIFDKEVDRIYLNVPKQLQVVDKKKGLRIIQETEFSDAVVWNPWIDKAKRMSAKDYGEFEYKEMVCVEVAEVGLKGNAVELSAGKSMDKTTTIWAEKL